MRWLGGAVASCAGFAFAVAGTFEPLRDEQGVEYVFAAPAALTLVWLVAVVLVVLALLFVAIAARARRLDPTAHPDAARRWLAPLCVPGIVVLGLAPAIPGIGVRAAPLGYYFYDLRWW